MGGPMLKSFEEIAKEADQAPGNTLGTSNEAATPNTTPAATPEPAKTEEVK